VLATMNDDLAKYFKELLLKTYYLITNINCVKCIHSFKVFYSYWTPFYSSIAMLVILNLHNINTFLCIKVLLDHMLTGIIIISNNNARNVKPFVFNDISRRGKGLFYFRLNIYFIPLVPVHSFHRQLHFFPSLVFSTSQNWNPIMFKQHFLKKKTEILDSYICRLPRPAINISDSFWYVEIPSYTFSRTTPQSWVHRSTDILLPVHYQICQCVESIQITR